GRARSTPAGRRTTAGTGTRRPPRRESRTAGGAPARVDIQSAATRFQARPSLTPSRRVESGAAPALRSVHEPAEAEGTHVGPDLLDVRETIGLRTGLPLVPPASGVVAIRGPDGILLLVIDNDLVDRGIVLVVVHGPLLRLCPARCPGSDGAARPAP